MPPFYRTIQQVKYKSYQSHHDADLELSNLVSSLTLTKKDAGYKQLISFLGWQQTLLTGLAQQNDHLKAHWKKILGLVDDFFNNIKKPNFNIQKDKEDFKTKWRELATNTDEHLSTQSMYIILHTLRKLHNSSQTLASKQQIDMDVVRHFAVVASNFRLPTNETGHNVTLSGNQANSKMQTYQLAHPRGPSDSIHLLGNSSPLHSEFDITRRFLAHAAGADYHNQNQSDGTGTLLTILKEAVKFTLGFVANPFSSENTIQTTKFDHKAQVAFFHRRERLKSHLRVLHGGPPKSVVLQKFNDSQYKKYLSPAAKAMRETTDLNGTVRQRATSPSLSRTDPV